MASFLFGPTPHEEAVAFIRHKPALSRAIFDKLLPELKARAFTVAGIEYASTLQRTRDTIAELPAGGDWEEVKGRVLEDISPYFVTGDDPEEIAKQEEAAKRRAELLLRTHGQQAYSAAGYRDMDEQRDIFTHWQYWSLGDGHVRPSHAALDGIVMPCDSSFWLSHYPPWDWGCRCYAVPLSQADVQDIQAADEKRTPETRQMLDGAAQEKLEKENLIVRPSDPFKKQGYPTPINVQSPAEAGKPGAFHWHPGDVTLHVEDIRGRYDPDVFDKWEKWARETRIPELQQSVWEWLSHGV